MAIDDIRKLDSIDLSKLSVADVKQLKNETLKKSLMDALQSKQAEDSFQMHLSHTDHSTALDLDPPLI